MQQRWISVKILMDDGWLVDEVWATNNHEALIVAGWNWELAEKIEVIV